MKRILCLAVIAAALPAGAQTIYKCPSANGSTVLQQMPCTGGQLLDVRPSRPSAPPPLPAAPRPQAGVQSGVASSAMERMETERRINAVTAGMSAGYPVVGMTASQLNLAMGRPTRVNSDDYGSLQKEQRIYERGEMTYLVYVQNGAVTAVQRRQGASSVRRVAQCNEQEIRNLEARATSISLSESERSYYLRQASEMRSSCRQGWRRRPTAARVRPHPGAVVPRVRMHMDIADKSPTLKMPADSLWLWARSADAFETLSECVTLQVAHRLLGIVGTELHAFAFDVAHQRRRPPRGLCQLHQRCPYALPVGRVECVPLGFGQHGGPARAG